MFTPITQVNRAISIETPLPFDTLLLDGFSGAEAISRPFHFEMQLLADTAFEKQTLVKPDELIGNKMTINIPLANGETRFINGVCRSFSVGKVDERFAYFKAELVPWFALLSLSSDIRFFQNKTVPEIIESVFGDLGYQDFRIDANRVYTKWDYCCQYRESDFNFISRLMESEGLFYYFEHTADRHVMVITDAVMSYQDLPHQPNVRLLMHGSNLDNEDVIRGWETRTEILSSKWTTRDYHFEMPRSPLEVEEPALHATEASRHLATYDFPGEYAQKFNETSQRLGEVRGEGEKLIKLRMETEEVNYKVVTGSSDARALVSGFRINVTSPAYREISGSYLLTAIQHKAFQTPNYISNHNLTAYYDNTFTAIPADVVFRSPRTTPKPSIQGPHTAFVVDEHETPQEEIWPDKFGRVRVRFPWDRRNRYSCWLRVAQPWAGRGWGHQWVPRVGDEVLVDFIEGDPDQPIVIGSVYNTDNMPPFKLPDYKTQSGIVTRSTKEGTPHQFNMLRFDDKKGYEQVMLRSQRRADVRVYGNYYDTCHANRNTHIGWKDDRTEESGGDYNLTVSGDNNVHILKNQYEGIDEKVNLVVKSDVVYDFQTKHDEMVKDRYFLNAKNIVIEGLQSITLSVGSSVIKLDLMGITIDAPMVKINSGSSCTLPGPPAIDDPLDAELSDNGEPGYLSYQRRSGGGGRWRRRRTLDPQRGPMVTRDPNGDYRVGRNLVVDGRDPGFTESALNDVAVIGTRPEGQRLLNNIDSGSRTVRVVDRDPALTPADPLNAYAQPGTGTPADYQAATPAGQPVFYGNGAPVTDSSGNQLTGTGTGTDSTVGYRPSQWPAPGVTNAPSDAILMHEMEHANHMNNGTYDGAPRNDCFTTNEEFNTIGPENTYRDQSGVHQRTNHKDL